MFVLMEDEHRLEYYEYQIQRLEKERCKIVQRGRLSEYEDICLYEIDDEKDYWSDMIYELYCRFEE